MRNFKNIKSVLIDFDGVIAKNSLDITLAYADDFINQYTPYHIEALKSYYISINSFDLKEGVTLLFKSLGLQDYLMDFLLGLRNLKTYKNQPIVIREDYAGFVNFCKQKEVNCKIFSLADKEKIENLLGFRPSYVDVPSGPVSKANPQIFHQICQSLNLPSSDILVIDDDPFVLRSAKLAGLKTVLMKNEFYNGTGTYYLEFIDMEINSFSEMMGLRNN